MLSVIMISVVVPVFNSEKILTELYQRLEASLQTICGQQYEIIFVDDCSTDSVWKKIKEIASIHPNVKGIRLGRNFGQWMAALAGMSQSSGKYIVTIDDDLEYDPADIQKLFQLITSQDLYMVFGVSSSKYIITESGVYPAKLRYKIINLIWNKFPTDSFKIFKREILFAGSHFAPRIHFEAFVKHTLDKRFIGYVEVRSNKRLEGKSNHPLWRKIHIFLAYSSQYYRPPVLSTGMLALLLSGLLITLNFSLPGEKISGFLIAAASLVSATLAVLIFHYASVTYSSLQQIPDYWIIETTQVKT